MDASAPHCGSDLWSDTDSCQIIINVGPGTSDLQPQPLLPVPPVTEVAGPNPAPARADKASDMHVDETVSLGDHMDVPEDEAQASSLT